MRMTSSLLVKKPMICGQNMNTNMVAPEPTMKASFKVSWARSFVLSLLPAPSHWDTRVVPVMPKPMTDMKMMDSAVPASWWADRTTLEMPARRLVQTMRPDELMSLSMALGPPRPKENL